MKYIKFYCALSLRFTMLLMAIAAVVLAMDRWARHWSACRARAEEHERALHILPLIREPGEYPHCDEGLETINMRADPGMARRHRDYVRYHALMARKYRSAMWRPWASVPLDPPSPQPKVIVLEPVFRFGAVARGTVVDHTWVIRNEGRAPLQFWVEKMDARVHLGDRCLIDHGSIWIASGSEIGMPVGCNTHRSIGNFERYLDLGTNDLERPVVHLRIIGSIITPYYSLGETGPPGVARMIPGSP